MPTKDTAIQFKAGLQLAYEAIVADANTVYFTTDSHRFFVGDVEYSRPVQHGTTLPTGFNPPNSLFYHETEKALYYSEDGKKWTACSNFYVHPSFTAAVVGDQTAGALAFGGTIKVPKITVDAQGHVSAAEDISLTLPAAPEDMKVKVATDGEGNAFTAVAVNEAGDTLTFTKGQTFALKSEVDTAIAEVKATADTATTPEEVDSKINAAIANVTQFDIDEGPEGSAGYENLAALKAAHAAGEKGVFYLVKNPDTTDPDSKFVEYIWTGTDYEMVGKFGTIDTSNFATKDEIVKKLASAVAGDIATLTAEGQIQDSGIKAADLATKEEVAQKVDKTVTINGQPLSGNVTITEIAGNADTATKLETPVKINNVPFDGSADITIPTATSVGEMTDAQITDPAAGNVLAYDAESQKWVNRTLTKNDVGLDKVNNTPDNEKNVASAAKLATARVITLSKNVSGSAEFDGTKDIDIQVTVNNAAMAEDSEALGGTPAGDYALKTEVEAAQAAATLKWGTF